MKVRYVVENGTVSQQLKYAETERWKANAEQPSGQVWSALRATLDTGLLPRGLRVLREAGPDTQVVVELPPEIARLTWADYEGGPYTFYLVAQPWRVVIGTFANNNLVGARVFYRPAQLHTLDDELFHSNLANVNCLGYHDNAVGWLCLYARHRTGACWGDWIEQLIERCSGVETYNDANMSATHGPTLYQQQGRPEWMWRRATWELETERQGLALLDDAPWIPVLVRGIDEQGSHFLGGVPLTLRMALDGRSAATYNDPQLLKLPASLARGNAPPEGVLIESIQQAMNAVAVTRREP